MLIEYKNVYQPPTAEGRRRWFSDRKGSQLIVWYAVTGHIRGFQFCYHVGPEERAFTWHLEHGYSHSKVVSDGGTFGAASPVLSGKIAGPITYLIEKFSLAAAGLEPGLLRFVRSKMNGFSLHLAV